MLIQWLGHSCFLIVSENGTKIITDPYESGAFGGGLNYDRIRIAPDIVTVSHKHADHGNVGGLPNHFEVVSKPGTVTVKGIEFKGIASYHDPEQGAIRGENVIFVMTIDGVRVCHLGDLGQELTHDQIAQMGQVDILMIPVGGYYTIEPDVATRLVQRINPKVVIPMHFKTPKVEFPIAGVDVFLAGKKNVKRLNSSEYEVTRETLPVEQEIVVLNHAL